MAGNRRGEQDKEHNRHQRHAEQHQAQPQRGGLGRGRHAQIEVGAAHEPQPGQQHQQRARQHEHRSQPQARQQQRPHDQLPAALVGVFAHGSARSGKGFIRGQPRGHHVKHIRRHRQSRQRRRPLWSLQRGLVEQLLAHEAQEGDHARHAQRGQRGRRRGVRHSPRQPAQLAHVAAVGGMIHAARHHEQRRFVERMHQQEDHRRLERDLRAHADEHDQRAQPAHRGIGQDALQVVLLPCDPRAHDHRRHAHRNQADRPPRRIPQHRRQPRQQIDARLDHRCRVQIRAHRRGRGHRPRQPEMEGELGRLGKRARQDQEQDRAVQRMRLDAARVRQQRGHFIAAPHAAQQHQPSQQCQPAAPRHQQRLQRGVARLARLVLRADQQIRTDAGQFPKQEKGEQIARSDQPHHRDHKDRDDDEKARQPTVAGQIRPAVEEYQRADATDQQRHEQGQPIHVKGKGHAQAGHPRPRDSPRRAAGHLPDQAEEKDRQAQRQQRHQPAPIPGTCGIFVGMPMLGQRHLPSHAALFLVPGARPLCLYPPEIA